MHADDSAELQGLLDRLRRGNREARRLLLERACEQLCRLAGRMLHGSFPELARRHELDSVVHETWLRLFVFFNYEDEDERRDGRGGALGAEGPAEDVRDVPR
jgi:hypothetical protein